MAYSCSGLLREHRDLAMYATKLASTFLLYAVPQPIDASAVEAVGDTTVEVEQG